MINSKQSINYILYLESIDIVIYFDKKTYLVLANPRASSRGKTWEASVIRH